MSIIIRMLLLVAFTFGSVFASDVPGYLGNQTFLLNDDPTLINLTARVEAAKLEFDVTKISQAISERDNYLVQLLSQIKKINFEGSRVGLSDGRMDGSDLYERLKNELNESLGIPVYPGDFEGPNFKPKINHNLLILEIAFADGYKFNYHKFTRVEFQRRSDTESN